MGHIYTNLPPLPVPNDCYVNKVTKQVSRYYRLNGKRKRHVIGRAIEDGMMYPNDVLRTHYPTEWDAAYGKTSPASRDILAGMYSLALGIGWKTGVYPALQGSFGHQAGNVVMDLAMFLIRHGTSAMQHFQKKMENQLLFSRKAWGGSYISDFLSSKMSEESTSRFREAWLKQCIENGRRSVWLCIDGSNIDCQAHKSKLAQHGHAKSHNSTPIISFIWAVDASDGTPITWFVNPGSTPDCKAFDGILRYLAKSGLDVKGVILDRGFATQKVIDLIRENGLDYIVMLTSNSAGFTQMLEEHGEDIRMNLQYVLEDDDGIFGKVDRKKMFQHSADDSYIALYFSFKNNTERVSNLLKRIVSTKRSARKKIENGQNNIKIPEGVQKYISVATDENGNAVSITCNSEAWDAAIRGYGYFAIASSAAKSAAEIFNIYQLRESSETQFSALKSQIGYSTARVHTDESFLSCMALGFVAALLRNELKNACKELGQDTNVMIDSLDRVVLMRMPTGEYEPTFGFPDNIGKLLECFDVHPNHIKCFAEELNTEAKEPVYTQVRKLPALENRTPGRPKGSKSKKTLEREAEEAELRARGELPPKRKPGRPKGSKSKKTLEREAREAELRAQGKEPAKRNPGRPKGSKNKKTLEREAREAEMRKQRGPGRPKGSKNQKTLDRERRMARLANKKAAEAAKASENKALQSSTQQDNRLYESSARVVEQLPIQHELNATKEVAADPVKPSKNTELQADERQGNRLLQSPELAVEQTSIQHDLRAGERVEEHAQEGKSENLLPQKNTPSNSGFR